MSLIDDLRAVDPARTFIGVDAPGQFDGMIDAWVARGFTVRVVRGHKMRTLSSVFDEFAAALQFPLYFGQNKDAFDECIRDLPRLPVSAGIVVVVVSPDETLADAPPRELEWLVDSLSAAAAEWATPIDLGEWWDRAAVPFHVVLDLGATTATSDVTRWIAAGARLDTA